MLRVGGTRYQFGPRTESFLAHATRADVEEWAWRKYQELKGDAERIAAGLPDRMPMSALLKRFETDRLPLLADNTRRTYAVSFEAFRTYFV